MNSHRPEKNPFASMGKRMLFGAVIGAALGILFNIQDAYRLIKVSAAGIHGFVMNSYIVLMILIAAAMVVINTASYLKLRKLVLQAAVEADEDTADVIEHKINLVSNISLHGNSILFIFTFVLYGLQLSSGRVNDSILILVMFLIPAVLYPLYYILIINLLKKHDPSKKGNPGTVRFQKDWLESCDEAEQMRTYKIGYQSMHTVSIMLVIVFGITAGGAFVFDSGEFAVIMVGLIWLLQTIICAYYTIKSQKEKLR